MKKSKKHSLISSPNTWIVDLFSNTRLKNDNKNWPIPPKQQRDKDGNYWTIIHSFEDKTYEYILQMKTLEALSFLFGNTEEIQTNKIGIASYLYIKKLVDFEIRAIKIQVKLNNGNPAHIIITKGPKDKALKNIL